MMSHAAHFVFEVSACSKHEGCWLYRLVPHRLEDTGSRPLAPDDVLRAVLAKAGINTFGVCCRGTDHSLLTQIPRLSAYLQVSLHKCLEQPRLSEFCISFRDELLSWRPVSEALFKTLVSINVPANNPASPWACSVLFAALFECLSVSPEGYSIARVYAAWQRYSLIKVLYDQTSPEGDEDDRAIITEFAAAYRALATLLLGEANSHAFHILWRVRLIARGRRDDKMPHPQIRERLRLSMFVRRKDKNEEEPLSALPSTAPGCFESAVRVGENGRDQLHLRFQRDTGGATVHRFISEELLPRYVLTEALDLICVARFGQGRRLRKIWVVSVIVAAGLCAVHALGLSTGSWLGKLVLCVGLLSSAIPLIGMFALGLRNAITFSLPRVLGGIAIGYFPLLVAQEPWYFVVYASRHPMVWLFEWTLIAAIVGGYLYREAFPFVLERREARRRALKVLVWAMAMAVAIGLWLCFLASPILRQLKYEPQRVDRPHLTTAQRASDGSVPEEEAAVADGLAYRVEVPFLRPVFWGIRLDWVEFPAAALLTFAPIALLLGIILQLLWEEKPITASVWPSESR